MWSLFRRKPLSFCAPQGVRIYAIGDIHGKADLLRELQSNILHDAQHFSGEKILEIYLGDYIDRGGQSREVIDILLEKAPLGHERICLRGNHEQALLDALINPSALRGWMQFGGLSTLASYGVQLPAHVPQDAAEMLQKELQQALPPEHLRFVHQLPLTFTCGDYFFVHAGVRPHISLNRQKNEDMLCIRDEFLSHRRPFDKFIVHGHSPNAKPELLVHRANLDVSNAAVPSLCALKIEGDMREIIMAQSGIVH